MDAALLSHFHVIIVPGLHNSGPDHWQTRWQARYPGFARVQQDDWDHPQLDAWVERLDELRASDPRPALLGAHCFGCRPSLARLHRHPEQGAGALLVAPAHPDRFGVAVQLPDAYLPCPATLISSSNDPWMPAPLAARFALRWGTGLVEAGALGHINAGSGLGDWPAGQDHLHQLAKQAQNTVLACLP